MTMDGNTFDKQNEESPTPNNPPATLPDGDNRLHDKTGSPEPKKIQDIRRRLVRLTIPTTLVPESSGLRVQSASEPYFFPLSTLNVPDLAKSKNDPFRTRNVVVFGESGVGKSSVINMIAGGDLAQTSNNAAGCTFRHQCHHVVLDGLGVNLWDTVGLDEGTEGTVPAAQAESSLKAFLRQVTRRNGIDLLLYCIRGTRVRQALLRNYNVFYAAICRKKVPVALVVTGLENYEGEMGGWWTEHEKDLIKHGMHFDAHACVTTMHSNHPAIQNRLEQSREALRNLVRRKFNDVAWRADEDSLLSASLPDVRALLRPVEKRVVPLILICDATEQAGCAHCASFFLSSAESSATGTNEQKYKYRCVDARDLADPRLRTKTKQRADLLIFYADADSNLDQVWATLEQFHLSFGGRTCPIIIVFGGLDNHEAATETWRLLSSSHDGEIIANPTYYPSLDGSEDAVASADEALTALIEEKCLITFEEKLTKFQKFCRHSKLFFTGHI